MPWFRVEIAREHKREVIIEAECGDAASIKAMKDCPALKDEEVLMYAEAFLTDAPKSKKKGDSGC